MDEKDRLQLNELAQSIARGAGNSIVNIPGIEAVCITFVGDQSTPVGTLVYDKEHQNAFVVLKAIDKLSKHIGILVNALGTERDAGNHSEGVVGEGGKQAEPDGDSRPPDTTPEVPDSTPS